MTIAYAVQDSLPNVIQFLPTGGPNGGPAFKLDSQGATPTILAIRVPLPKISNWSVAIDYFVNTTNMLATSGGYEGCGVRSRLLRHGAESPLSLYDNGLLTTQSNDWHTVITGWHNVTQRIDYPPNLQPEVEDIQFCVKGPVGGHVLLSELSVVNRFERVFEAAVTGESSNILLTRRETGTVPPLTYATFIQFGGMLFKYDDTYWDAYLSTETCDIKKGEDVSIEGKAILNGVSDSDSDLPWSIDLSVKFLSPDGNERWVDIETKTSNVATINETLFDNTVTFTSDRDYSQFEIVVKAKTFFGRDHSTIIGHKGIYTSITTRRALLSNNG